MAYNHQQVPFWEFVRQFDNTNNGAGVDHAEGHPAAFPHPPPPPGAQPPNPFGAGFPFGPGGFWGQGPPHHGGPHHHEGPPHHGSPGAWGRGGRRGRHCRRRDHDDNEHEHEHTPSRSRSRSPNGEHTEGEDAREGSTHGRRGHQEQHGHGHGPRGFGNHGRGRGGWGLGGFGARGGHRGPPPFGSGGPGGFDLSALFESLSAHPLAQAFRTYAEGQQSGETLVPEDAENSFIPPVDVFSTEKAFVLHVALPGAKKEDVGVNWDSEKGLLNLAGVVYRQGDEEFLKTLSKSERKVGVFERSVKLPPGNEEKEEIDGDAITAKLEDGVLVVTVPKIEKEWTEVKKVDIV